jgi:hypothetical protein
LFGTLKQKLDQVCVEDFTHQNLNGHTPAEARAWLTGKVSAEPLDERIERNERSAEPFVAWDGLLIGYRIRWKAA